MTWPWSVILNFQLKLRQDWHQRARGSDLRGSYVYSVRRAAEYRPNISMVEYAHARCRHYGRFDMFLRSVFIRL